jgi:hypothetical protein
MEKEEATRLIRTTDGEILVSEWMLSLWEEYGWPNETTLRNMADNYERFGLVNGGNPNDLD